MITWMLVWEDEPGNPESAWSDGGLYTDEDLAHKAAELSRRVAANPPVCVAQVDYGEPVEERRNFLIATAVRHLIDVLPPGCVPMFGMGAGMTEPNDAWTALVAAVKGKS